MLHVGRKVPPIPSAVPELIPGDRLTQGEFHRRYEAHPDETKFELVGGIVYMASPAGLDHGTNDSDLATALGVYRVATPGVRAAGNVTVILGENSEPQPDRVLFIDPAVGGQAKIEKRGDKNYLVGAPELIAEIAHSSAALDLHRKREDYRLGGVREYIVVCVQDREVRWFDLREDREKPIPVDGILRSFMFPGLWLDAQAIVAEDGAKLLATVNKGLKSPEHKQFVAALAAAGKGKPRTAKKTTSRRKRGSK
jgi:Uma2 family endonuclease